MTSDPDPYDEEFGPTASDLDVLLCLDNDEELTAAQLVALARLDDGPLGSCETDDPYDPGTCPPEDWDPMADAERQAVLDIPPAAAVPEVFDAGFTHRDGGDGRGFAAGGALGRMAPGRMLTAVTERAWEEGLGRLSDDELVGVMAAARRGASRQAALELATIGEVAARRAGPTAAPESTWRKRSPRR